MARPVLLNNIDHKGLKVKVRHSSEHGDAVNQVVVFPSEFGDIQKEYPIFFNKTAAGEYQAVALLGFDRSENLFLSERGWSASYIPAFRARGPFMIGFQEKLVDGELKKEPMIHVDLDDPRVNAEEGESVFLSQGGNSPYLEHIINILRAIHEGMEIGKSMFALFDKMDLFEPVSIDVNLNEHEQYQIRDYYTIKQDKLRALDGASLELLNRSGFLMGAYLVMASQANVARLIDIKNRKRTSPVE